ncbi:MAG: VCBS repeat-containing protein, partial [Thermoanaerobaculia bacterium]|nr:VCBS repeat-containing protein [Thermoanaerobaculia bacterium]
MRRLRAVLSLASLLACGPAEKASDPAAREPTKADASPTGGSGGLFEDRALEAGLDFAYFNGMSGELYMVEMVGGGVALLDYDGDGDLDVFLPQGRMLPADRPETEARVPPRGPLRDRLFRNEVVPEGRLRFTDVTVEALPDDDDYGQGAAVGDVDGDGDPDLVVTNYGVDRLLRNLGDGRFESTALPVPPGWSTAATFLDYDGDGRLDIFVARYLDATLDNHFQCTAPSGLVDYCGPLSFAPLPDALLRNRGDGTF